MTKLYERLSIFFPKIKHETEGEYGVEIETETKFPDDYPDGFLKISKDDHGKTIIKTPKLKSWMGHVDNSLRNYGIEFIFKKPYSFKDSLAAIDEFGHQTKTIEFIKNAPSTSVHVHWNVFNETFLTMVNFLTLYALYENILIAYCGPLRRSNLFALPIRVAETTADTIVNMINQLQKGSFAGLMIQDNQAKYGAINLASICRLGSLELRSMCGTTDPSEIKEWLSIINQMVLYSRSPGVTPSEILDIYRDDPLELFSLTFGSYAGVLRETAESDPEHGFEYLVEKNLWYPKLISETVPDWSKFNSCMDEVYEAQMKMLSTKSVKKKSISGDFNNLGVNQYLTIAQAGQILANNAPANVPLGDATETNTVTNESDEDPIEWSYFEDDVEPENPNW